MLKIDRVGLLLFGLRVATSDIIFPFFSCSAVSIKIFEDFLQRVVNLCMFRGFITRHFAKNDCFLWFLTSRDNGFAELEAFINSILSEQDKMRLKLDSRLGVVAHLLDKYGVIRFCTLCKTETF